MVEPVLSFVVEGTLARAVSLITDEISLAWNLKDDLKELKDSVTMIRGVLQDAEEQQTTKESVRLWLEKLREVAYEAEDVFDELAYETLRRKVAVSNPSSVATGFAKKVAFHVKIAHKVKKINRSLDRIRNQAMGFGLQVMSSNRIQTQINLDRVTDSILDNPVVGREADVSRIVNLLTHSCSQQVLTILPIVGMGGLGKTALAKSVCQDVSRRSIFDAKIWVCVSENFNEQKILGEMLQSLNATMGGLTNKDAIIQELENALGKRKFLLILDDVWENVSKWWDDLKCRLLKICNNKGNAVLVTTRSEQLASIVESSTEHRHMLGLLSDDDCWSILKERAYKGTSIPSDLECIGREIARKCRGVPLAAKVLGGTLGFNRDEKAWSKLRDTNVLNLADNKENVESILKLSFDRLPSYLKPCFAFCSIFPKDYWFVKEQLIQFWMAEGFVESCDGEKGGKYFNALLLNSFFQDVERNKSTGDVVRCKMHHLVHDLALSLSKSETLTLENYSASNDTSLIRRLYVDDRVVTTSVVDQNVRGKKLRTIVLDGASIQESWKLKRLRTLTLRDSDVEELPSSIGKLKHLRYLDVSNTQIKAWPESIGKLYNLHTLKFCMCKKLPKLPREKMSNLISLKHIDFSYEHQMPAGLGRLSCLEELPFFVVDPDGGGSIQELECLNELSGQLSIRRLEKVRNKQEAERANLSRKIKIEMLDYQWSFIRSSSSARDFRFSNDLEVLEGLRPHPNIKSIHIRYYLGETFPSWICGMKSPSHVDASLVLNNLVDLSLSWCNNCEQLPELGNLPCLKFLNIKNLHKVRMLGNEFYGIGGGLGLFPALKSFSLEFMPRLIEWRAPNLGDEDGARVAVFPCLEELSIVGCQKLKKIPLSDIISSLVKVKIDNCQELDSIYDELQSSFPSLTSLSLGWWNKLTCLPNGLYSNTRMEELGIWCCKELTSIPEDLGKLSSLTSLSIVNCSRLSYFPENILSKLVRLEKLGVGDFSEELDDFHYLNSIQDLPCLKELYICGSSEGRTMSLPDQLQGLTALLSLRISAFGMEVLPEWLLNLQSLQSLTIGRCSCAKYQSTTKLLQRFFNLRDVWIYDCPFLDEDESQRWSKFSRATKIKVRIIN